MEIKDAVHAEKDLAGAALLDTFKDVKIDAPIRIGSYRGFEMLLTFKHGKSFQLTLKGELSHVVELGKDTFGNISRINNQLLELPARLKSTEAHLENLYKQMADAKEEMVKPFPFEQELKEKSERLAALDAELNLGESMSESVGCELDEPEDDVISAKSMRPSILENLRNIRVGKETPARSEKPIAEL